MYLQCGYGCRFEYACVGRDTQWMDEWMDDPGIRLSLCDGNVQTKSEGKKGTLNRSVAMVRA